LESIGLVASESLPGELRRLAVPPGDAPDGVRRSIRGDGIWLGVFGRLRGVAGGGGIYVEREGGRRPIGGAGGKDAKLDAMEFVACELVTGDQGREEDAEARETLRWAEDADTADVELASR
jgi:hypothetical protein